MTKHLKTQPRKKFGLTGYYSLLALLVIWQLGLTLYHIGNSIGCRAQLAQLSHQYHLLSQQKMQLSLKSSQKVSLATVEKKAESDGFVKIQRVARIGLKQHLAAL